VIDVTLRPLSQHARIAIATGLLFVAALLDCLTRA